MLKRDVIDFEVEKVRCYSILKFTIRAKLQNPIFGEILTSFLKRDFIDVEIKKIVPFKVKASKANF